MSVHKLAIPGFYGSGKLQEQHLSGLSLLKENQCQNTREDDLQIFDQSADRGRMIIAELYNHNESYLQGLLAFNYLENAPEKQNEQLYHYLKSEQITGKQSLTEQLGRQMLKSQQQQAKNVEQYLYLLCQNGNLNQGQQDQERQKVSKIQNIAFSRQKEQVSMQLLQQGRLGLNPTLFKDNSVGDDCKDSVLRDIKTVRILPINRKNIGYQKVIQTTDCSCQTELVFNSLDSINFFHDKASRMDVQTFKNSVQSQKKEVEIEGENFFQILRHENERVDEDKIKKSISVGSMCGGVQDELFGEIKYMKQTITQNDSLYFQDQFESQSSDDTSLECRIDYSQKSKSYFAPYRNKNWVQNNMTDRDEMNDCSDVQSNASRRRGQQIFIWEREGFCVDDNQLKLLQEKQTQSEGQQSLDVRESREFYNKRINEMVVIAQVNQQLRGELQYVNEELQFVTEKVNFLQQKNHELQVLKLIHGDKINEVLEQNKELNDLVQEYKHKIFEDEQMLGKYEEMIQNLQRQVSFSNKQLEEKDARINELMVQLQQEKLSVEEIVRVNYEIQEVLKSNRVQYQYQVQELQKQIHSLHETISFYKERLEEEGINLNVQQISIIKEAFQKERHQEIQKFKNLERSYQQALKNQSIQTLKLASQLKGLKKKDKEPTLQFISKELLERSFEETVLQYDKELEERDSQIFALKKEIRNLKQMDCEFSINSYGKYMSDVRAMYQMIRAHEQACPSETEFAYLINKLLKINSALMSQNNSLQYQKSCLLDALGKSEAFYRQFQMKDNQHWNLIQREIVILKEKKELYHNKMMNLTNQLEKKKQTQKLATNNNRQKFKLHLEFNLKSEGNLPKQKFQAKQSRLIEMLKKCKLNYSQKLLLSLKLLQFIQKKSKFKELSNLAIDQIIILWTQYGFDVSSKAKRQSQKSQYQANYLYAAPEVLLGFSENEKSWIWSLGVVIDELFHNSIFYKRINTIKSRTDNYYCRNPDLAIRAVLESMLKKDHKQRCTLEWIHAQVDQIISRARSEIND